VGKYLTKSQPGSSNPQQKRNLDFGEITQGNSSGNAGRKKQKVYGDFSQFG
jgi:hypothetical protein